jgi:hypothetical protein
MSILKNFTQFGAAHWQTGSVRHTLNYQGAQFSEGLLLGITGGVCVGYFSFAYEGFDPHVALLTRNTFDPLDTLFDRLGVIREVRQTTSAEKGLQNVINIIDDGKPAIIFADMYSLDYNATPKDDGMWVFMPLVVYGVEGGQAYLSDRSSCPLVVPLDMLERARGRTKDNKYKCMTLDLPTLDKLPRAVQAGIESCIRLYTEAPPKGARTNFGFAALDHWAELLVKTSGKTAWAKVFPHGRALYAGLTSTYTSIEVFGTGGNGSRAQYADFLDEAAIILNKPGLHEASALYRKAATAWDDLSNGVLPDAVEPLRRTRALYQEKGRLFTTRGRDATAEMQAIQEQLYLLKQQMETDFPLTEAESDQLKEAIRAKVLAVRDVERDAVRVMGEAML